MAHWAVGSGPGRGRSAARASAWGSILTVEVAQWPPGRDPVAHAPLELGDVREAAVGCPRPDRRAVDPYFEDAAVAWASVQRRSSPATEGTFLLMRAIFPNFCNV